MQTIEGVEYVSLADLAELWGVENVYTIRNRIYAEMRKNNRFPEADIKSRAKGRKNGILGGATPALWRYDRLAELTAWWNQFRIGAHVADTTKTIQEVPETEVILFTSTSLELSIADNTFPQFAGDHIRVTVTREGRKEWYFITLEQAQEIMALFE